MQTTLPTYILGDPTVTLRTAELEMLAIPDLIKSQRLKTAGPILLYSQGDSEVTNPSPYGLQGSSGSH